MGAVIALIDDANVRSDKPRHEGGAFFMSAFGRKQPLETLVFG
jgi:hypothetical protein